jgi:uncharacterized protein with GYD domain
LLEPESVLLPASFYERIYLRHEIGLRKENSMSKYLVEATYTAERYQGLAEDKASGRKTAITQAVKTLGGKLDSMYFCRGERDVILVVDMPDNVSVAALSSAASATGMARTKTTVLLTVEEADAALIKPTVYRAPGA